MLRKRRCELRQRIRVSVTVSVALDLPAPLPTCGVAGPKITSDIASASSIPIGSSGAPNTRWKPLLALASSRSTAWPSTRIIASAWRVHKEATLTMILRAKSPSPS